MKRLNMVKAARGWSVGTMWPAPCRKQVPAVSALCGSTTAWPTAPVSAMSDHSGTNCKAPPQPYLNSEEGNVGELFHEAPDLVLTSFSVEPRPASHLHLGIETAPSVPSPTDPTASPCIWADPSLCPFTFWHRESTNHSSPRKLQAMSTSPLYTRILYFCRAGRA